MRARVWGLVTDELLDFKGIIDFSANLGVCSFSYKYRFPFLYPPGL